MPSNDLPLRVFLSVRTWTSSKLINFSDGGGEPSTQPFQPFLTATRFLLGCRERMDSLKVSRSRSSSSSGVRGLLEEVCEVTEEAGPGVERGEAAAGEEGMGGGVTDVERWLVAMWMVGLARQKAEVLGGTAWIGWEATVCKAEDEGCLSGWTWVADKTAFSAFCRNLSAALARFLSRSLSLFSFFLSLRDS